MPRPAECNDDTCFGVPLQISSGEISSAKSPPAKSPRRNLGEIYESSPHHWFPHHWFLRHCAPRLISLEPPRNVYLPPTPCALPQTLVKSIMLGTCRDPPSVAQCHTCRTTFLNPPSHQCSQPSHTRKHSIFLHEMPFCSDWCNNIQSQSPIGPIMAIA